MLKYTLIESKDGKIRYKYHPEGGSTFGIVSYSDGKCSIEILAENDKHERYALKMFKKLREMEKNKVFVSDGSLAWY